MALQFAVSRPIAAAPERVWALLADTAAWKAWNPTIISIDGSVALGSRIRLVSTANPKRAFSLTVNELAPPRRMVWADGMPLGLFRGVRTYEVTPGTDGACMFSMTEVYSGALLGMIGKSIPDLGPSFQQFADGLKAAAERR